MLRVSSTSWKRWVWRSLSIRSSMGSGHAFLHVLSVVLWLLAQICLNGWTLSTLQRRGRRGVEGGVEGVEGGGREGRGGSEGSGGRMVGGGGGGGGRRREGKRGEGKRGRGRGGKGGREEHLIRLVIVEAAATPSLPHPHPHPHPQPHPQPQALPTPQTHPPLPHPSIQHTSSWLTWTRTCMTTKDAPLPPSKHPHAHHHPLPITSLASRASLGSMASLGSRASLGSMASLGGMASLESMTSTDPSSSQMEEWVWTTRQESHPFSASSTWHTNTRPLPPPPPHPRPPHNPHPCSRTEKRSQRCTCTFPCTRRWDRRARSTFLSSC